MNELSFFLKKEGNLSFWRAILLISVISGIANAGLLALINSASQTAQDEGLNYQYFIIYIIVFMIYFIAKKFTMVKSSQEIEKIIKNTRERISGKVQKSELITIESINKTQIFTRLTRDTDIISEAASMLIGTAQSLIMIIFSLIYLLIISKLIFFTVFISIIITILIYSSLEAEFSDDMVVANKMEENFFQSLDSIIEGFKELKMNSIKNKLTLKRNHSILDSLLKLKLNLAYKLTTAMMFTEMFLYILLGVIVFVIPHIAAENNITIIQATAALLFIIGPLEAAVNVFPMLSRTIVSIESISDLEQTLDTHKYSGQVSDTNINIVFNDFKDIILKEIEFSYLDKNKEKVFGIGAINLKIKRATIVFIIGGNGSGKSTFIKTLLGLYQPTKGEIYIDNYIVDKYNYQDYRNLFSIILTDFYMFKEIDGVENIDFNLLNELLCEMKLNNKTKFINGAFTTTALSTGQKKRLALVVAILEDKPILVLDEWAADQDPSFRKYFYETILIRLRKQGKTIIAVTHDDAYFKFSDEVLKMDYGKLVLYNGKH